MESGSPAHRIVPYAEILFRPLSRRRLRTFWPSVVRMRILKPCVLLLFRLFGWKVRFILAGPVQIKIREREILPDPVREAHAVVSGNAEG